MFFITRNDQNKIIRIAHEAHCDHQERLAANHPDILQFLNEAQTHPSVIAKLQGSDTTLIRVLEDLVNLLVKKNLIQFTELPEAAQHKLMARKEFRSRLQQDTTTSSTLLQDDDSLI